ncbi:MFS transporter [Amycolatopsis sp. CA-230715]|uniref:MFS transporter n=1 Tax=Amycolatopsis sp. CA-230715 TaxID=2745196 RepID=UPI001C028C6C|nr:MFS transporter [Amycolatopsis sp. CA-230715]QWF85382.1 Putative niacin/nicotinamide transporter NaiP [Amycolatopsis sp. CA-230715]
MSSTPATPTPPAQHGDEIALSEVYERMRLRPAHVRAGAVLFVAFVLEAWEMLALVYIGPDVEQSLHIDSTRMGVVVSALFFGMIPGTLLAGSIADRIGRRQTCAWSLGLYGVCTALGALAPGFGWLLVARFAAGLVLSGLHAMAFPYFEELLPARVRGKATVYLSSGWALGILLAVGTTALVGSHGWRLLVLVNALAGFWALAIWKLVPESPYWLVARGRTEQACRVLRALGTTPPPAAALRVPHTRPGSVRALFGPAIRRRTIVLLVANFTLAWGYWGLQTGLPAVLAGQGLSLPNTLTFLALGAVVMIPGYLSASVLTHRFGRKIVFIGYLAAACAGGLVFATAANTAMLYLGNFTISFFSLGAFGVWNTWLGECYPTSVRGVGYSWGIFAQRVANAAVPSAMGAMAATAAGSSLVVGTIDVFLLLTALLASRLPETEGRALE